MGLEKRNLFLWSPFCQVSLYNIKIALTKSPISGFSDPNQCIFTDAAKPQLVGVFTQERAKVVNS